MPLTDAEIESIRYHLRRGNIDVGGYPYTPDGGKAFFETVIAPNLTGDVETTADDEIAAGEITTVTPAAMTQIVSQAKLVIDVGDDAEVVNVKAVTGSTFTARFAKDHTGTYVVALYSGHARLRLLLHRADLAFEAMTDSTSVGDTAGLKQVDKGDVEWFEGFRVLRDRKEHYMAIINEIASLLSVRVPGGGGASVAVY